MKNQHLQGRRDGEFLLLKPSEVENELPFQIVGVGCDFFQYPVERPFGFPSFQWLQTQKGCGILQLSGSQFTLNPGTGFLIYPGDAHSYRAEGDSDWYVNWITFSGATVPQMLSYLGMRHSGIYSLSHPQLIDNHIHKAFRLLSSNDPLKGLEGSVIIYELLIDFLRYIEKEGEESRGRRVTRLQPVFDLIERDIHTPLGLDVLASEIGVTPQYFCDLFKEVTSLRPVEYINHRRIERAKELLLQKPPLKIKEVAHSVGFESDSYFGSVFRNLEGISPSEYRQ